MKQTASTTLKKFFFSGFIFVVFVLFLCLIEFFLRFKEPSTDFAKVLFFNQFKLSRWEFLSKRHHQLNVDWVLNEIAQKNADYEEPPEPNRPAFDKVPFPYPIKTNQYGFRDRNFPVQSAPSIVLLGDSVGFGKGVKEQERFFSLLKHRFPHMPFYNLSLQGCTADCMTRVFEQYVEQLNPRIVIIQASSNDIDQTLWREGVQQDVPDKPIPKKFQWHSKSYLSQWMQLWIHASAEDDLRLHSFLVEQYYEDSLTKIMNTGSDRSISMIALDLPFAYGWNYGGHLIRKCERNSSCTSVSIQWKVDDNIAVSTNTAQRFDVRTAKELQLSLETIHKVFPNPEFFLDVVHLTPAGHMQVADALQPTIDKLLKQR